MTRSRLVWVVGPQDAGVRADVVLGRRVAGLSRRAARTLARAGALRIDGRPAAPWHHVTPGEQLIVEFEDDDTEPAPLHVLASTQDFVYVDKPAGVHTHRLRPDGPAALADAVIRQFPECGSASEDPREGGAIHRLDRATTGVLAFARNAPAWRRGRAAMADPATAKLYLALVCAPGPLRWPPQPDLCRIDPPASAWWFVEVLPQPQSATLVRLDLPLGLGPRRESVVVRPDGRPTHCEVVALAATDERQPDGRTRALLAVALGRGHRHQIRVHLAWLGLPIEGDSRYGGVGNVTLGPPALRSSDTDMLRLHCAALDLRASCPGEARVAAPLPAAFADRLCELRLRPWATPDHTW